MSDDLSRQVFTLERTMVKERRKGIRNDPDQRTLFNRGCGNIENDRHSAGPYLAGPYLAGLAGLGFSKRKTCIRACDS